MNFLFWKKKIPFYRKKKFIILTAFLGFFLAVRAFVPQFLLRETNKFLATFSPQFIFHIDDFDLDLIKGSYQFEKLVGVLRSNGKQVLAADRIDVSISWKDLWYERRIVTDILLDKLKVNYLKDEIFAAAKNSKKENAKEVKDTLFPLDVKSVTLENSKIVFEGYPSLKKNQNLTISNLNGSLTNLTPTQDKPISLFRMVANVFGPSPIELSGHLRLLDGPPSWDIDTEFKNFDLPDANPFLWQKVPLTINKGKLDLYGEARSQNGKVKGYVKPFFKDLDIMKSHEHFKNAKHFFIEFLTAVSNLVLRNKTKTVATEIPFKFEKQFQVEKKGVINEALKNAFDKPLRPGIDNTLNIE